MITKKIIENAEWKKLNFTPEEVKILKKDGLTLEDVKKYLKEEGVIVKKADGYNGHSIGKIDSEVNMNDVGSKSEGELQDEVRKQWYEAGIKDDDKIVKLERAGINPAQLKTVQSVLGIR
jgi:hypothetical protein